MNCGRVFVNVCRVPRNICGASKIQQPQEQGVLLNPPPEIRMFESHMLVTALQGPNCGVRG